MTLRRLDPLADLLLQERSGRASGPEAGWRPPIDLYETADQYVVTAELPGIPRDAIQVDVLDNTLRLRGRRAEPQSRPGRYQQLERGYGPFARTFRFPQAVDSEAVTAAFRDGVLTVTVPKATRPQRISVE